MKKMTSKAMVAANGGGLWMTGINTIKYGIQRWFKSTFTGGAINDNYNNRSQYDNLIGIKH